MRTSWRGVILLRIFLYSCLLPGSLFLEHDCMRLWKRNSKGKVICSCWDPVVWSTACAPTCLRAACVGGHICRTSAALLGCLSDLATAAQSVTWMGWGSALWTSAWGPRWRWQFSGIVAGGLFSPADAGAGVRIWAGRCIFCSCISWEAKGALVGGVGLCLCSLGSWVLLGLPNKLVTCVYV